MKKTSFVLSLLLITMLSQAQVYNVKDSSFAETFAFIYKSAGNYFSEIKGAPIKSTLSGDTIGYRLRLLPAGVTDWKHISEHNGVLNIFFKLGEYSTDSAEVAVRYKDLIQLIKETDPTAVFVEDDSYSDTKIKEVNICTGGAANCGEDDKWRVSLYFHKMSDGYNVSVNMQSYPQ